MMVIEEVMPMVRRKVDDVADDRRKKGWSEADGEEMMIF